MVIQCWLEQGVSPPWGHPSIRTPGMSIPSSLPTGMLQTLQTEQETWLQLGRAGPQCWQDDAFCLPLVGWHWSLPNKKKWRRGRGRQAAAWEMPTVVQPALRTPTCWGRYLAASPQ